MDKALIFIYIGGGLFLLGGVMGFITGRKHRNALRPPENTAAMQPVDPRLQVKSVIDFNRNNRP